MDIRKDKKALDKLYRRRDRYDLQPDFQREKVWSETKQQKLMDTILKKWDIPKIYLRVVDEENFECIDGQQRMTAIFKFYDNELKLPKESGKYAGLYYNDLSDKIEDIFDDYELDIELIDDASDDELRELFARLQLGMPLNSAEKLNAMSGNMRDFVKNLSENDFFTSKTPLSTRRYAFQAIAAQICLLEIDGIKNAKFSDLSEFYKRNGPFDVNSQKGKKILRIIEAMNKIFPAKTSAFRNRAAVISFYLLLSELIDNSINLTDENREKLRKFYTDFQQKLKNEIEKGADAEDAELIVYQSRVNQAADSKDSILKRHQILRRRLINFDSDFKNYLDVLEKDKEIVELQKKENIKQLTDDSIDLLSQINKSYVAKHGNIDLFKMTTESLKCIRVISTPVSSKDEFKKLVDSLYKLIYEGSGALKRIPESLIKDDSILFDIKHLRTDLFHDVEHGNEKKIIKKKETIASIYTKYANKKTIDEIDESFLFHFQREMLEKIKSLLEEIKKEI